MKWLTETPIGVVLFWAALVATAALVVTAICSVIEVFQ